MSPSLFVSLAASLMSCAVAGIGSDAASSGAGCPAGASMDIGSRVDDGRGSEAVCLAADGGRSDAGASRSGEAGPMVGMTAAHNAARLATHRRLAPLTWDDALAASAQTWAQTLADGDCSLAHSNGEYGENLFVRGTNVAPGPNVTAKEVVRSWTSEKACYAYGTVGGSEACSSSCQTCGHYTQIVWANTRRLGCGHAACTDGGYHYEIWVCHYDPAGNYLGEYPY